MQYCAHPNTYIVEYWRLVNDPENESRRIFDLLDLTKRKSFHARLTKEKNFGKEERENILGIVRPQLELLTAQGTSALI